MSTEVPFFTQRDAAVVYSFLAARCEALFRACGRLAPAAGHPAATAALATFSRRVGRHADAWAELVPESVLLAEIRAEAPTDGPEPPDAGALPAALGQLRSELHDLLGRTAAVADEPARRLARAVLADLDEALAVLGTPGGR